jgi:hypothetical protein
MAWYHYVDPNNNHLVFQDSSVEYMQGTDLSGTYAIICKISGINTPINLTPAQALKIIGTLPPPL